MDEAQGILVAQRRLVKGLRDGGVGLLLGTDSPAGYLSGFGVHHELQARAGG